MDVCFYSAVRSPCCVSGYVVNRLLLFSGPQYLQMKWPLLDVPGSAGLKDSRSPTPGHLVSRHVHSQENFLFFFQRSKPKSCSCDVSRVLCWSNIRSQDSSIYYLSIHQYFTFFGQLEERDGGEEEKKNHNFHSEILSHQITELSSSLNSQSQTPARSGRAKFPLLLAFGPLIRRFLPAASYRA